MSVQIQPGSYNLPDINILRDYREEVNSFFWIPDKVYIVLGVSNKAEEALIAENVICDKIPVIKRPSGGETVILTPKTLVISAVTKSDILKSPKEYFKFNNDKIKSGLNSLGIEKLYCKGISDISIGDRKILGSAIYRTRDMLFYQAVLNVSENPLLFEKYLKHPKREPDYRKGRLHSHFVTSIHAEGYNIDAISIIQVLKSLFE